MLQEAPLPQAEAPQRRWVPQAAAPETAASQQGIAAKGIEEMLPLQIGEQPIRIADLQQGQLLGSGGFGSVYRGLLNGEEVAIKRMNIMDGCQISEALLEEFSKEIKTLQGLRHPRLIRYIGVALEPPVLCIVTELAPGGSLYALLHVNRVALEEARRRTIVLQIAEGVAWLHSGQPPRVHRDLKSANVVLNASYDAKLCDFGLTESMEKTHISRRESEAGSPRYMAPEVFDSRCKLTEKIDVWALGCLIAEVLLDRVPHVDCSTIQQVAAKLLVHMGTPYEEHWADHVRPEVISLVNPCFLRKPDLRPSAQTLLDGMMRLDHLLLDTNTMSRAPERRKSEYGGARG